MQVHYVKGELGSHEVIKKAAAEHDVVIHAATADDEPSVRAVLAGIEERSAKGLKTVYIHTSGKPFLVP